LDRIDVAANGDCGDSGALVCTVPYPWPRYRQH
jgi:hypothetical protein